MNDNRYWNAKQRAASLALQNHTRTHSCLRQELEDAEAAGFRFELQGGHMVPLFDGLGRREAYLKYCDWLQSRGS